MRVNAKLIESKTEESISSFQIDGTAENILNIADSLSKMIRNYLVVSKLKKELFFDLQSYTSVNSPEAYRYFTYGQMAFLKSDYPTARNWILLAIAIDSNFYSAINILPVTYAAQGLYEQARKWALWVYNKRDQMPLQHKVWANWLYAKSCETPHESTKYMSQLLEFDNQVPLFHYQLGLDYMAIHQYDKAVTAIEKAFDIYKKWDSKPMWIYNYYHLGIAYHKTGLYKKEKELYKRAEQDFPEDCAILPRQAILSLSEGDINSANRYIEKYVSNRKNNSWSDAAIAGSLAGIYSEAGILDKAEEYYRQALSLEPERPVRLNSLANFLIDNNRNINEGMELVEKALAINPDYYIPDTKGWGLFKLGKYKESLELLEKAWELKPLYDHGIYLHLQEARKAVAGQR